ncbi:MULTISPECIES: hypothetical protein [Streptomycetaceae]|uniref:hypothetical protein n=1 Tax=Streptomycetaceae TaxID=2062 RepID=UPI001E60ED41|nr:MULTISPECIES: hypothetical protein [Streptomycetaceae]
MKPLITDPIVSQAASVLSRQHSPAGLNQYGRCTTAGYSVGLGPLPRQARVHHQQPGIDLCDPDRPTSAERAAERRDMVAKYAATLEAADWIVVRKTASTGPILLATPAAPAAPLTAHVRHASKPRQGDVFSGGYHLVLNQPVTVDRFRRDTGEALCKPRDRFSDLALTPDAAVTCRVCRDRAARYGITISGAPEPGQ